MTFINSDIRYAMKHLTSFLILIPFAVITASGQSPEGILKIFSENPLVVTLMTHIIRNTAR